MLSYSCVVMIPCAEPGGRSLAAEVLRFQRVQSQEEKRKTGVHARESGAARAREAPERLAVEQFLFLREKRSRIGGDRCSGFVETPNQAEPMKKPRPPKPRTGHPTSSNDLRPGHPPKQEPRPSFNQPLPSVTGLLE